MLHRPPSSHALSLHQPATAAPDAPSSPRRAWLWAISPEHYPAFLKTRTLALRKIGRPTLEEIRSGDVIFAYLSGSKVIAGMFEAVGETFQDTTPLVASGAFPHRLRVRPVVTLSEEAWVPYEAFHDRLNVVQEYNGFRRVVQQVIHPLPKVDEKVLEFLVRARQAADLETVLEAYGAYLQAKAEGDGADAGLEVHEALAPYTAAEWDRAAALEDLIAYIEAKGFVYEPWQVAAYVTATRTKPLVILAGVTGTGKSKLPALVAEATSGVARLIPVRPDWTDSADVLGYIDLQGRFRPGAVLQVARDAAEAPHRFFTCIIDEMNLARVEQYFAEVLSRIEDRRPARQGGFESAPLLDVHLPETAWQDVRLPPNLALAGTVNMDESAHAFSRKVLDRAFTLELADVDLAAWQRETLEAPSPAHWPVGAWYPRALTLGSLANLREAARAEVERAVEALLAINGFLAPAQVQVAYRARDEIALFVLHAADVAASFRTRTGEAVDPLDLALHMKVLPRLVGGSRPLRRAVLGLLGWAYDGEALYDEEAAHPVLDAWEDAGRPSALPGAAFPRTSARLCLMWERLLTDGFTSFWV